MAIDRDLGVSFGEIEAVVAYVGLPDEVVPEQYFKAQPTHVHEIPQNAHIDPFAEAERVMLAFNGMHVAVLVPGRAFDVSGARHGRGGGWYDRFLSAVPKEWLRIGFCFGDQFSETPLTQEEWDESVDFVCVVSRATNTADWHETHARDL